jgi:hypothetical protein
MYERSSVKEGPNNTRSPRQPLEVFGQVRVAGDVGDVDREYPGGGKPSVAVGERGS